MAILTNSNHPQPSHDAAASIVAAGGDSHLGASQELMLYVGGFVEQLPEPFTFGNVQFAVLRAEIRDGRGEYQITSDTSVWRALDAMRKSGLLVNVGTSRRGALWRRVK
jgi:hypothetical protein